MKTDLYTKVILTVIAVALTINLLKEFNVVTPAQAAPTAVSEIKSTSGTHGDVIDVNIVGINGTSVSYSTLPVKVDNYRDFR